MVRIGSTAASRLAGITSILAGLSLCIATAANSATPQLAGGGNHSIALRSDGTVVTWGSDGNGELGSGRVLTFPSPVPIAALGGVVALTAGLSHTIGLKPDGTLIAVGDNLFSQLGDGTETTRTTPGAVVDLTGVVAVDAGRYHNVAAKSDGTVWAWGYNVSGEIGDGTTVSRSRPTRVQGLTGVVAVSAGEEHSAAVKSDGTVWTWGSNGSGRLGDGTTISRSTPVRVAGLTDAIAVSAGEKHTLALKRDGTVWAWGYNFQGQLGNATTIDSATPVPVSGLAGVVAIGAGYDFGVALKSDGTVWAWGYNLFESLGDGGTGFLLLSSVPVRVAGLTSITAISVGYAHTVARRSDGTVWTWGQNIHGQIGDGTTTNRRTAIQVPGLLGVTAISAGEYHTHAIGAGVFAWGSNDEGQLGAGLAVFRTTPGPVAGLANIVAVAAGYATSYALRADGTVWSWGSNTAGTLGAGPGPDRSSPVQATGLTNVVAIDAGFVHAVALRSDGTVWSWGSNTEGQLGREPGLFNFFSETPVQIPGMSQVVSVAAGDFHTLASRSDGTVLAIGFNRDGELGDGTTTNRSSPVVVPGINDAASVAAGDFHSFALRRNGTAFAWGANFYGQLGDGTTIERHSPVGVTGLSGIASLSGGLRHSVARTLDGRLFTWGANDGGQLGQDTSADRLVPTPVPQFTRVAAFAAGNFHTLAATSDGSVFAWGDNREGELGDGTVVDRALPVVVRREGGAGSIAGNDWFLDLEPAIPTTIPADKIPVFLVVASPVNADIRADVRFRAQDVGTTGSVYVFALAPADIVRPAANGEPAFEVGKAVSKRSGKETAVSCVLAQLNASGQLQSVSASSLQAFVSGVLSGQGAAVTVINGATAINIGGATFFVGYGPNSQSMLNGGLNRGVVSVPGAKECKPQAPQSGWWWYPPESGRGYSIEVAGRNIFYAAFLYDDAGRSKWYVATGQTSLDGSLFTGDLLEVLGGQTLFGPYRGPSTLRSVGPITLAFNSSSAGTQVWPGGTIPIERFAIIPNGLTAPPQPNVPESGWWWNPEESGRGFFIEWQNGSVDIAGYMYDDAGNAVWYLTVVPTPDPRAINGAWWTFGGGQTLLGAYRPNTQTSNNFAPVAVNFDSPVTGTLTLPGGRTTRIVRHRF